jgi:hypothetical protein
MSLVVCADYGSNDLIDYHDFRQVQTHGRLVVMVGQDNSKQFLPSVVSTSPFSC